jgi:hypothetical protein
MLILHILTVCWLRESASSVVVVDCMDALNSDSTNDEFAFLTEEKNGDSIHTFDTE